MIYIYIQCIIPVFGQVKIRVSSPQNYNTLILLGVGVKLNIYIYRNHAL